MNATDERMMILKMIEEGTVSADEGARLLSSVDQGGDASTRKIAPRRDTGVVNGSGFELRIPIPGRIRRLLACRWP